MKTTHIIPIALLLGACTQIENPEIPGTSGNFSVYLSEPQTKTVNEGMVTKWLIGDNISLFHAVAGTETYVTDNSFTCDNVAANKFSGTLAEELDANANYDWYATYPVLNNSQLPNNCQLYIGRTSMSSFDGKVTQAGNNSMAHLAGGRDGFPIAGFAKNVPASDFPTISMRNLSSVIGVNVENTLDEQITVKSINLVAPKPIIGQFNFDLTNEDFAVSGEGKKIIQLEIQDGSAIAKGESAKFYIGVAPFTASSGSELLVYVNASIGENSVSQRFAKDLMEDISFKSGMIKTLNVDYTQTGAEPINVTKSDFHTLNRGITKTVYKVGNNYESFDGWKVLNGAVLPLTELNLTEQPEGNLIVGITGDTKGEGVLTSPLIAGGCKTLTFQYGIHQKNNKIGFKMEIKDASGTVLYNETVNNDAPEMKTPYTYTFPNENTGADVKIEGPFQIVITNLGPSGKTGVLADKLAVCNIEWTSAQ